MEFLKLFQNHSEYDAFVSGDTMVKPNVSHCVSENEVHYNPLAIMTVRYNVTDASNPTQLYFYTPDGGGLTINGAVMFDKVEIDGTEVSIADLDGASGKTQLSAGEHTVKYTLKDPTLLGIGYGEEGVPSRVGAIFGGCYDVISVEIPNSVSIIGIDAFSECTGLTSVTIPNSVTSIEEHAFYNCIGLTSVVIPDSVENIWEGAFQECTGLTSVAIGNSVTSIGGGTFAGCSGLTSVTIPNSVTSIGRYAFSECTGLTSVTIGNSVSTIGDYAFCDCPLDETSRAAIRAIRPDATECRDAE